MGSSTPKPTRLSLVVPRPDKDAGVQASESDGPDTLKFSPVEDQGSVLDALPTATFERRSVIQHETDLPTNRYYEILQGFAQERLLTSGGKVDGDPRDLQPGDLVGITRFARVVTKTPLVVRIIDLDEIARERNVLLLKHATNRVIEASLNRGRSDRQRLIELASEQEEMGSTISKLLDQVRELDKELRSKIERRIGELVGKTIRPLRAENLRLREDNARYLKDRKVDAESLKHTLESQSIVAEELKDEVDTLHKEREGLISLVQEALEAAQALQTAEDIPRAALKALAALGGFYSLKMRPRKGR